jgi:hypothetical protein
MVCLRYNGVSQSEVWVALSLAQDNVVQAVDVTDDQSNLGANTDIPPDRPGRKGFCAGRQHSTHGLFGHGLGQALGSHHNLKVVVRLERAGVHIRVQRGRSSPWHQRQWRTGSLVNGKESVNVHCTCREGEQAALRDGKFDKLR